MPRASKPLPPPSQEERDRAREAAAALHDVLAGRRTLASPSTAHLDLDRPRRGQWWTTWENLPGFTRVQCSVEGLHYRHECLPGWTYTKAEIRREMIPDLEALAERGERPTIATNTTGGKR